jgi:hypothetical protein
MPMSTGELEGAIRIPDWTLTHVDLDGENAVDPLELEFGAILTT